MRPESEPAVLAKGREIFRLMEEARPKVFDRNWWAGRVMDLAMRDEHLKTQMFRFVDVLPALNTAKETSRHIREYFLSEGSRFPQAIRAALSALTTPLVAPATAIAFRKEVEEISRNFIVGEDFSEARKNLKKIYDGGKFFTVDLLGEVAVSEREAEEYLARYLSLVELLSAEMSSWEGSGGERSAFPGLNISVKISSLYSRIGPRNHDDSVALVKERLRPIFRAAKNAGGFVNLDMEAYDLHGITYEVFMGLLEEDEFRSWEGAGLVIQAYMRSAGEDLENLIGWARSRGRRLTVRLVKGAYWEHEVMQARQRGWPVPVFEEKTHTDWNFERCTAWLFGSHGAVVPAIASHNVRSLAHAIVCAEQNGVGIDEYEIQMLYGMAEPIKEALVKLGHPVREYSPVGALLPGMAYLVRRLLENTSNEGFLRKRFADDADRDELLLPPCEPDRAGHTSADTGEDVCALVFASAPVADFRKGSVRDAFRDAIETVRGRLGASYPVYVGSAAVKDGGEIVSRNPADPTVVVGRVTALDRGHADKAVTEARAAQKEWGGLGAGERVAVLQRAAGLMRTRRYELAAWQVFEAGKNWAEADADVCEAIDMLEYYGREMLRLAIPRKLGDAPGEDNRYRYLPRGVGLVIAPWNFPLAISTGMTSAALVTGNTVLYKPSSLTPVNGWLMEAMFREAGIPPGVLTLVPGGGDEVGGYLVEHPGIDFITFTGSRDVGLGIIEKSARQRRGQGRIKRVVAEMGGKNAIIVDADADLDMAVTGVVQSAFGFQGQKCSACSRAIVLESAYDRFLERLVEAVRGIPVGPPEDPSFFMGPVIDEQARKKILGYVRIGDADGTRAATGSVPEDGFYVPPVVLTDLKKDSRLLREEIFGPVLCVLKAADMDEAIAIANDSEYALTAGLFSRSPGNIQKVTRELGVGNLYINRGITGAMVGRQPFGGFRMSGVGSKAGGPDYLSQFMEPQTITENTARRGFAPELMS